jgi:hypothetical protein
VKRNRSPWPRGRGPAINNNTPADGSDWPRRIKNNLPGDSNAAIGNQALRLGA